MDVVANKGPSMVCLSLYPEFLETLVQGAIKCALGNV